MNVPETLKMNVQLKMSLAWELHKGRSHFFTELKQDPVQRGGNLRSAHSSAEKNIHPLIFFFAYLLY